MFLQILENENLIFYLLGVEGFLLILLQLWTGCLLRKGLKMRRQKRETLKQVKEEVKQGTSQIPVVKFEKQGEKKTAEQKNTDRQSGFDPKEMAVLQEMMAEFFG